MLPPDQDDSPVALCVCVCARESKKTGFVVVRSRARVCVRDRIVPGWTTLVFRIGHGTGRARGVAYLIERERERNGGAAAAAAAAVYDDVEWWCSLEEEQPRDGHLYSCREPIVCVCVCIIGRRCRTSDNPRALRLSL